MSDSVAIVVLDTLRKDAFDEFFDWLPGLSFERALSPSHWTTPVHGSLFTGAYSSETGVHAHNPTLDCPQPTLAEKLSQSGWTCRGFSANGNVAPSTNFDRGFDEFTAKGYHSSADIFEWQNFVNKSQGLHRYPLAFWSCVTGNCDTLPSIRRGVQIKYDQLRHGGPPNLTAGDAHEFLVETDFGDREFLFLNLMEAHDSYTPPSEYQTIEPLDVDSIRALTAVLDPGESIDGDRYRQSYKDSVRYLAEKYRSIHGILTENFDYVITVSDHGEAFDNDGIYGHIPSLIPEIVHVPLSIWGADVEGGVCDKAVNLLDIHRTVADITGVANPPHGQNLLETDGRATLTEAHGVSEWQREALLENNVGTDRLENLNELRRGIQGKQYFAYESIFDGWVENGQIESVKKTIESLVDTLDEREDSADQIPEKVRTNLENMGYV